MKEGRGEGRKKSGRRGKKEKEKIGEEGGRKRMMEF